MESVNEDKRPLQKMFRAVPPSYDVLNRILTFGLDESWRRKAAVVCLENSPARVMDLCCGTGDLVIHMGKIASPGVEITALDYSEPMLDLARAKAVRNNLDNIEFIHGDASSMPFPDNYFDSIGIAFAFRNLTFHNPDRDKFLLEILRVLKPGGRFVIVETSQPKNFLIRKLFHWYLKWITAPAGGIISGHHGAYKYLAHSARHYHDSREVKELLGKAGFGNVKVRLFMGGITGIFSGECKPVTEGP
jgi:demethylmenaquinone methyltransferase / 2-methoxy-6-polyprenyl-1,4-benzoquinol methylase